MDETKKGAAETDDEVFAALKTYWMTYADNRMPAKMGGHVLRFRYKNARKDTPKAEATLRTALALNRRVVGETWKIVLRWLMAKREATRIAGPAPR
eukprot:6614765-Pyramimonas_sp.AAC.1